MELISLVDYAKLNGIDEGTARQRALRGRFKTAKKIGRNWVIDKNEPLIDNRGVNMENGLFQERLTDKLIEELNHRIKFVYPVDLSKYDTITMDEDVIQLYHEEYEKTPIADDSGEIMDYSYINKSYTRLFKRNNMSGFYVEC